MTLNALASYGVQAPVDRTYRPYPYWTQDAFVHSECVASNCTAPCELAQVARAMDCVPDVASHAYHADELWWACGEPSVGPGGAARQVARRAGHGRCRVSIGFVAERGQAARRLVLHRFALPTARQPIECMLWRLVDRFS